MLKTRTMYEDAEPRRVELEHLNEADGFMVKMTDVPFDATSPHRLSRFWAELLGWSVALADPEGNELCVLTPR